MFEGEKKFMSKKETFIDGDTAFLFDPRCCTSRNLSPRSCHLSARNEFLYKKKKYASHSKHIHTDISSWPIISQNLMISNKN